MPVLGEIFVKDKWDMNPELPEELRKFAEETSNNRNAPNFFVLIYEAVNKAYKRGYEDAKKEKE
ncbi:MAG: hypothetical protein WA063_06455 [Minisyncoccia bacterium]